jgi:3-phenylpropionate/trans-cinnamate dioxygenase ferredoxin reductase component
VTDKDQTFVIVGASLAGAKAAETLRSEGFEGRILLIGEEASRPYERPPLSKEYLRGEKTFDDSAAVHPSTYYDEHHIELRTTTVVTTVDTSGRTVTLRDGEQLQYDRLLLTTGATPRRLEISGAGLAGVRYLRTVEDSDALRSSIQKANRLIVVGAGWIGCEVAASARQLGAEVAMVEPESLPIKRVLGPEVGSVYRDLHAEHGVELHFGVGVESLRGARSVEEAVLSDGTTLAGDVVLIGVGVTPRTELGRAAGVDVDNGILVDEHLATDAPGVFAAGDVANAFHPLYGQRFRLEHWSAALNQGPAAARNMLDKGVVYDRTPYFYSDQYDLSMEYRGWAPTWDEVVFRGDVAKREFVCFWLKDGRVCAAMNANIWDEAEALESLVRKRPVVDPARLADAGTKLADVSSG